MPVILGLDFGTTSHSAVAVNGQGEIVAEVNRDHEAAVGELPVDYAEQDPRKHLRGAIRLLKEIVPRCPEPPIGIAITGQMHGVVFADGAGEPVSHVITWQDRRAARLSGDSRRSFLETLLDRCRENDLLSTGCRLATGYLGTTCFTLREQQAFPQGAVSAGLLINWIGGQLTGQSMIADRSTAGSTGLYDLEHDCWSGPLCEAAQVPIDMLPPVIESGTPIGTLRGDIAREVGLPEGITVTNPIGDNQASVIGSVPQGRFEVQVTVGTGGQINWPIDRFRRQLPMDTRYLPDGRYLLVGAGIIGGATYAWVNDAVRSWLEAFGITADRQEVYARLNQLAQEVIDDQDALACEPFFRGTRFEPLRRGVIRNVGVRNFTPGHLAVAVCRGMADTFHGLLAASHGGQAPAVQRIIAGGNGIRRNAVLAKCLADRFGCPVLLPRHTETSAYGAALLTGVRLGVFPSLEAATAGLLDGAESISPTCR